MFNYYQPTKIHFGEGRLNELATITKKYGNKVLLVTTADAPLQPLFNRVKKMMEDAFIDYLHFDQVQPNPSVELIENGFQMMKGKHFDAVIAIGGGSTIDSAKVLAFNHGKEAIDWDELFHQFSSPYEEYKPYTDSCLPIIAVPTTSGTGSQVTQAAVVSRGSDKITFFHPDLFSKETILDPELMITLPKRISAATGFDAFTHAFESYINPRASKMSEIDSLEAILLVLNYLPKVLKDPMNLQYRGYMAVADTLAGRALANAGAAAPHPLSEIIGGITHLPHGEALAVVFPSFIKHAQSKNEDKFNKILEIFHMHGFEGNSLYEAICSLLKEIELYRTLKECGTSEEIFNEIISSEVLHHLPIYSCEELKAMIIDSYDA